MPGPAFPPPQMSSGNGLPAYTLPPTGGTQTGMPSFGSTPPPSGGARVDNRPSSGVPAEYRPSSGGPIDYRPSGPGAGTDSARPGDSWFPQTGHPASGGPIGFTPSGSGAEDRGPDPRPSSGVPAHSGSTFRSDGGPGHSAAEVPFGVAGSGGSHQPFGAAPGWPDHGASDRLAGAHQSGAVPQQRGQGTVYGGAPDYSAIDMTMPVSTNPVENSGSLTGHILAQGWDRGVDTNRRSNIKVAVAMLAVLVLLIGVSVLFLFTAGDAFTDMINGVFKG